MSAAFRLLVYVIRSLIPQNDRKTHMRPKWHSSHRTIKWLYMSPHCCCSTYINYQQLFKVIILWICSVYCYTHMRSNLSWLCVQYLNQKSVVELTDRRTYCAGSMRLVCLHHTHWYNVHANCLGVLERFADCLLGGMVAEPPTIYSKHARIVVVAYVC